MSCRKRRQWFGLVGSLGSLSVFLFSLPGFAVTHVTAIDFKASDSAGNIKITADGPITFEKQENTEDHQVILELQGVKLSKSVSRPYDTSSFRSNVSLISSYQVKDKADTARIVIQLRETGSVDVAANGNTLDINIPNSGGASGGGAAGGSTENGASGGSSASKDSPPKDPGSAHLDEFEQSKTTQHYIGKPITIQMRDVDVADIFRLIGEASGFNIILGDDVKGSMTLSLVDVPWDQALDVILHTLHLGADRNNNILRVITLKNLIAEKEDEHLAAKSAEESAPRITKIFPISYAKLDDLKTILTQFSSTTEAVVSSSGKGSSVASNASKAVVQPDNRTNSLIVRDTAENVDRMRKLIELLDTQTPQVLIEAKIIEASEDFARAMGGNLSLASTPGGDAPSFASFNGGNPFSNLFGAVGDSTAMYTPGGTQFSTDAKGSLTTPGGYFGISPNLSFIPGLNRLNALLNLGEGESQLKVISSPRTIVLNKESAKVLEGTPVQIPSSMIVPGSAGVVSTSSIQSANLSLEVKPTVTNEGSVLLDLKISKDEPYSLAGGGQAIAQRNMQTLVLVENGTTLMLGGIYVAKEQTGSSGFPLLRKIPLIGWLFGSESESNNKTELFIFITPRILNMKESGLTSG